ncbi:uncharacterized protein N7459_003097 [Penicillium hispanicum]|uniref:uncharacterized protein n=1 Tax=Penicillium hispanicum TaxID=1080232 RepID=UPI002540C532|nr:uncharacterized protein N7459_003097 [Penicillium hispanicum]KAJ5587332.1 hypothetical protein N7459_003097 [Penicillium hispanicum]
MNIAYNYSGTQYCCGAVIADNGQPSCRYEKPFELPQGTIIPGVAFLEKNGVRNSSGLEQSSSCIAVEAGMSVPLGVLVIAMIIWALWECHGWRHMKISLGQFQMGQSLPGSQQCRTAELNAPVSTSRIPELADTGRDYKEVPSD